jgi:tRNA nucleotidyltransferase (CCA-adding enzyme)
MLRLWNIPVLDLHINLLKEYTKQDIFLVGGCVRDILLGITKNPLDVDATGFFSPDEMFTRLKKNLPKHSPLFRTEKFGTITMIVEHGKEDIYPYNYEFTPFREEGGYTDHRHPDEIKRTSSLLLDAGRRDFTMNAMYYTSIDVYPYSAPIGDAFQVDTDQLMRQLNIQGWSYVVGANLLILQHETYIDTLCGDGKIMLDGVQSFFVQQKMPFDSKQGIRILLDPKKWLQDALVQKLRTVWDPDKRFREDALRILRALRFVNIWNQQLPWSAFDFHKDTWASIKKQYFLVQNLAKERIHQELVKVFSWNNPFGYVALLDEANLLQYIFPALYRCKHNEQPIRYHPFDTYAHTLLTLRHLQKLNTNYLVKLGMLYHDVGKPDQYYYYAQCKTPDEIVALHASWANHIVCGPEFAQKDFEALGFSSKEIEEIAWYVAMHMRPGQILEAREDNQIKKVRAMYSEVGYERVKNILDICKADRQWQFNPLQSSEVEAVDILYTYLDNLRDTEGQFTPKELAVNGDILMKELSLSPGPVLWQLLEKAFQRVLHEKESRNKKDAILSYLKWVLVNETENTN